MHYLKIKKIDLLIAITLIDQIFFGLTKRVIFSIFDKGVIYTSYVSLFPVIIVFSFILALHVKKFELPKIGKSTIPYYGFIAISFLVTITTSPDRNDAFAFVHTYYSLLLIPLLIVVTKKSTDILLIFRNVFLITSPIVMLHTLFHVTFGMFKFEEIWATNSWASLYIGNIDGERRFRPFGPFEDPGYLSGYYVFGAFSLYLRPLKRLTTPIIIVFLLAATLPLKSSTLVAFFTSLIIAIACLRVKQRSFSAVTMFAVIVVSAFLLSKVSEIDLRQYFITDNFVINERLSLGTLKAREFKQAPIIEDIYHHPLGQGAGFVSLANNNNPVGYSDSDSQYVTLAANFGLLGLALYLILIIGLCIPPKLRNRDSILIATPVLWLLISISTEVLSTRFVFICIAIFTTALINEQRKYDA